jgi:acylphosphatase
MAEKCARVVFRGKVQGVWFRANTQKKALGHGLRGWVQNLEDGSVEALFQGDEKAIIKTLEEIERGEGMGAARVDRKEVSWVAPANHCGFDIICED